MDDDGHHENGRHKMDYYRGFHSPWNLMPQHQGKEQQNALAMNKKIMSILAERDTAIRERNVALNEKDEALAARDAALAQREKAIAEREEALMERDNALAALQYRESVHITNAYPISSISSDAVKSCKRKQANVKKRVLGEGKKYKTEWDSQYMGLNLIAFDESIMPGPVCSCTGVAHQCYKWGNGGWQSSCCTTILSQYPLPQMQNKRHTRVGGRKMSGSVFTRLLSRLAAEGHDLLVPLDLKDYWARHGTNRYITIK